MCRAECRLRSGGEEGSMRAWVGLSQQFRFPSRRHWISITETEVSPVQTGRTQSASLTPSNQQLSAELNAVPRCLIPAPAARRAFLCAQAPFEVWDGKRRREACCVLHACQRFAHPESAPFCIISPGVPANAKWWECLLG